MNGIKANGGQYLISSRTSNLSLEEITEVLHQGNKVDYDNDPEPENVPKTRITTATRIMELNWKGEGIICTRKADNLQNASAGFTNYAREDVLSESRLDLFFIIPQLIIWRKYSSLR